MDAKWMPFVGKKIYIKNGVNGGKYEGYFVAIANNKLIVDKCFPIGYWAKNNVWQKVYKISGGERRKFNLPKATFDVIYSTGDM